MYNTAWCVEIFKKVNRYKYLIYYIILGTRYIHKDFNTYLSSNFQVFCLIITIKHIGTLHLLILYNMVDGRVKYTFCTVYYPSPSLILTILLSIQNVYCLIKFRINFDHVAPHLKCMSSFQYTYFNK